MLGKIRAIVIFCAVTLVTVGMSLGPANAATMIACEADASSVSHRSSLHSDHHSDHRSQFIHEAHDEVKASLDHQAEHCSSHACVFGLSESSLAPSEGLAEKRLAREPFASSLVPLASPDGLRRPPRA
ncbi:MAG: hypothetical protein CML50_23360 [Rhodobacteraceae bacterium]|nr:hypothetical protein [Paracoccaceae bacterium]GGA01776.1 hypothetical protein GCM10011326_11290 [Salipiger profundus]